MVHCDHAKQVIVGFGDGLARPVLVDVANDEIFEVSPKGPFVCGHAVKSRCTETSGFVARRLLGLLTRVFISWGGKQAGAIAWCVLFNPLSL